MAALDRLPSPIPEIKKSSWRALARAAADLNQIARRLSQRGEHLSVAEVSVRLQKFRDRLVMSASDESED